MLKFKWETEFKQTEIGEIPKEWNFKPIGEEYLVNTGKRVSPSNDGSYAIYGANGFLGFSNTYLICAPAVITGRVGTLAKVFYVTGRNAVSDNAFYIRSKQSNLKYLYYVMILIFRDIEDILNVGTSQPLIKQSDVKKFKVPYPSLNEQSRIATVLSWFDDLIENKKRQNEILEQTAMAIFKNWFIDFEPFKDEQFVDSELGEIPRGWKVKSLDKVCQLIKGISYNSPDINSEPRGNLFITLNNFYRGGGFKPEYDYYIGNKAKDNHTVKNGDLIVALTDMTSLARVVGAPAIVVLPYGYGSAIISLNCAKIEPVNECLKIYLYLYLKYSQEENSTFASGVNVLHLNTKLFVRNKLVIIPSQAISTKFHSLVDPLFQKIITNQKQIMVLRKIRDALLPLLVFGKLRVVEI